MLLKEFHLNHVGYKVPYAIHETIKPPCFIWTMWDIKEAIKILKSRQDYSFIWTMWDIKLWLIVPFQQADRFHLNHVGYKASLYIAPSTTPVCFIWTMWDIKSYQEAWVFRTSDDEFHLNHVGYKGQKWSKGSF